MKIFLTGGTGFIGGQLLKTLLEKDLIVHALCRNFAGRDLPKHKNLFWFEGDLLDTASIEQAMSGCDIVFHTAAYARVWAKDPEVYYKQNVIATNNLLDVALLLMVKKVIITSSAGVIGPWGDVVADETSKRLIPFLNEYEETKAMAEEIALQYTDLGLQIVLVSPTRVYGSGKASRSNPTLTLIKLLLRKKIFFIPGATKGIGCYSFIEDVVMGHLLAMEKGRSGEKYILGGENVSYKTFINATLKVSNKKTILIPLPAVFMKLFSYWELMRAHLFDYEPWLTPKWLHKYKYDAAFSSDKAKSELGYQITPLVTGLKKTVESIQFSPNK